MPAPDPRPPTHPRQTPRAALAPTPRLLALWVEFTHGKRPLRGSIHIEMWGLIGIDGVVADKRRIPIITHLSDRIRVQLGTVLAPSAPAEPPERP